MEIGSSPKLRILETAEELFAARGLDGVSVRDIADQAQVNVAMINYYFGNKDGLYLGIIENYFEELTGALENAFNHKNDPRVRLRMFIDSYADFLFSRSNAAQLIIRVEGQDDEHVERLVNKYLASTQAKLVDVIRQGINEGYFRPVDPNLTVISLMGIIIWYFIGRPVFRRLPGMENYIEDNRADFGRHTWEIIFHGLSADGNLE
jgi:AcrR family transcriptional regulator